MYFVVFLLFFSNANCKISLGCIVPLCVGSTVCLQSVSVERCYIKYVKCVVDVEHVKEKVDSILNQECRGDGDIHYVSLELKNWSNVYRSLSQWFIFAHVLAWILSLSFLFVSPYGIFLFYTYSLNFILHTTVPALYLQALHSYQRPLSHLPRTRKTLVFAPMHIG